MSNFADLFIDETKYGHKIPTSEYLEEGAYPIIDQGKQFISGYSNSEAGIYKNVPAIIFGDHTRILKYVDKPFFIGADGVKILKPKNAEHNYKYLFYALKNVDIPDTGYNRHFKWLKDAEIKTPDLQTQEFIVDIFDRVNGLIQQRESQLSKLDQIVKARFVEMFGEPDKNTFDFEMASGKNLFKFSSGKFLSDEKRLQNGIPVYGGNGIAWYTDEPLIDYPTLVIGRVGAYCGNVRRIDEPVWITDNAIYIKEFKTSNLTLEFLFYLMKFLNFSQFADFSGQPKITQKPLENTLYIIPPLPLQEAFATFVQNVDKTKTAVKQSLEKLETLKKSLMQEYFG